MSFMFNISDNHCNAFYKQNKKTLSLVIDFSLDQTQNKCIHKGKNV